MDDARVMLDLSRRLSTLPDREAYLATAGQELLPLFDADDVLWSDLDLVAGVADVARTVEADATLGAELALHAAGHPGIRSYVERPADLAPRRVSDVAEERAWRNGAAYCEVFRGRGGRYQLSLVVELVAPVRGMGWTLLRDGRDFSDDDVLRAGRLLPLLTAMETLYRRLPVPHGTNGTPGLTERELELLRLLSTGLTATAIGRVLGIAPRTVRKHLEHVYGKLDAHDRVVALNRARALGYVPG